MRAVHLAVPGSPASPRSRATSPASSRGARFRNLSDSPTTASGRRRVHGSPAGRPLDPAQREEQARQKEVANAQKLLKKQILSTRGALKKEVLDIKKLETGLKKIVQSRNDAEKKRAREIAKMDATIAKLSKKSEVEEVKVKAKRLKALQAEALSVYLAKAQEMLSANQSLFLPGRTKVADEKQGQPQVQEPTSPNDAERPQEENHDVEESAELAAALADIGEMLGNVDPSLLDFDDELNELRTCRDQLEHCCMEAMQEAHYLQNQLTQYQSEFAEQQDHLAQHRAETEAAQQEQLSQKAAHQQEIAVQRGQLEELVSREAALHARHLQQRADLEDSRVRLASHAEKLTREELRNADLQKHVEALSASRALSEEWEADLSKRLLNKMSRHFRHLHRELRDPINSREAEPEPASDASSTSEPEPLTPARGGQRKPRAQSLTQWYKRKTSESPKKGGSKIGSPDFGSLTAAKDGGRAAAAAIAERVLEIQQRLLDHFGGNIPPLATPLLKACEVVSRKDGMADSGELKAQLVDVIDLAATLCQENTASKVADGEEVELEKLASLLRGLGRLEELLPVEQRLTQRLQQRLGPRHPQVLDKRAEVTRTLRALGRSSEAEPLQEQLHHDYAEVLGPSNPKTLVSCRELAESLREHGRHEEVEPLQRHLAQALARSLGPQHPSAVCATADLGRTLGVLGRHEEARPLLQEALDQMTAVHGAGAEEALRVQADLAFTAGELGQDALAHSLEEAALDAARTSGNPDGLQAIADLASRLASRGQAQRASSLSKRVLDVVLDVASPQHPAALEAALTLARAGDCDEAYREEVEQVLEANALVAGVTAGSSEEPAAPEPMPGSSQPHSRGFATLASAAGGTGAPVAAVPPTRGEKVRDLARLVGWSRVPACGSSATRPRGRGSSHAIEEAELLHLASLLRDGGHPEEAVALEQRADASMSKESKAAGRLELLRSRHASAAALCSTGRLQEAEALQRAVLAQCEALKGPDHPDTLRSCRELASTLDSLGRSNETEPAWRYFAERAERALGPQHPESLRALSGHAGSLLLLGRAPEAAPLLATLLERGAAGGFHGRRDPEMLQARCLHALALRALGKASEAAREEAALMADVTLEDGSVSEEAWEVLAALAQQHVEAADRGDPNLPHEGQNHAVVLLRQLLGVGVEKLDRHHLGKLEAATVLAAHLRALREDPATEPVLLQTLQQSAFSPRRSEGTPLAQPVLEATERLARAMGCAESSLALNLQGPGAPRAEDNPVWLSPSAVSQGATPEACSGRTRDVRMPPPAQGHGLAQKLAQSLGVDPSPGGQAHPSNARTALAGSDGSPGGQFADPPASAVPAEAEMLREQPRLPVFGVQPGAEPGAGSTAGDTKGDTSMAALTAGCGDTASSRSCSPEGPRGGQPALHPVESYGGLHAGVTESQSGPLMRHNCVGSLPQSPLGASPGSRAFASAPGTAALARSHADHGRTTPRAWLPPPPSPGLRTAATPQLVQRQPGSGPCAMAPGQSPPRQASLSPCSSPRPPFVPAIAGAARPFVMAQELGPAHHLPRSPCSSPHPLPVAATTGAPGCLAVTAVPYAVASVASPECAPCFGGTTSPQKLDLAASASLPSTPRSSPQQRQSPACLDSASGVHSMAFPFAEPLRVRGRPGAEPRQLPLPPMSSQMPPAPGAVVRPLSGTPTEVSADSPWSSPSRARPHAASATFGAAGGGVAAGRAGTPPSRRIAASAAQRFLSEPGSDPRAAAHLSPPDVSLPPPLRRMQEPVAAGTAVFAPW